MNVQGSTTAIETSVSSRRRPDGAGDSGVCNMTSAPHIMVALIVRAKTAAVAIDGRTHSADVLPLFI